MATKYICDKCGNEYNKGLKRWSFDKTYYSHLANALYWNPDKQYDLCYDCSKALVKWVEGDTND